MREYDALTGYPEPKQPRVVHPNIRTIHNRIVASYRGEEFYDGDRNDGYGGFTYDGRWAQVAQNMLEQYSLSGQSELPFADNEFEFIIAIGPVYSLNLPDAIKCLKEIQRVGKGKSFITLGAYETEEDFRLFRYWTLLGSTILSKDDWVEVLNHVGYTGDYKFNTAESLNLIEAGSP
jgi:hypothetical protein